MKAWSERAACQFWRQISAAVAAARPGKAPAPSYGGVADPAGRNRAGRGRPGRSAPGPADLGSAYRQLPGSTVQARSRTQARSGTFAKNGGVTHLRRRIRKPAAVRRATAAVAPHERDVLRDHRRLRRALSVLHVLGSAPGP